MAFRKKQRQSQIPECWGPQSQSNQSPYGPIWPSKGALCCQQSVDRPSHGNPWASASIYMPRSPLSSYTFYLEDGRPNTDALGCASMGKRLCNSSKRMSTTPDHPPASCSITAGWINGDEGIKWNPDSSVETQVIDVALSISWESTVWKLHTHKRKVYSMPHCHQTCRNSSRTSSFLCEHWTVGFMPLTKIRITLRLDTVYT